VPPPRRLARRRVARTRAPGGHSQALFPDPARTHRVDHRGPVTIYVRIIVVYNITVAGEITLPSPRTRHQCRRRRRRHSHVPNAGGERFLYTTTNAPPPPRVARRRSIYIYIYIYIYRLITTDET